MLVNDEQLYSRCCYKPVLEGKCTNCGELELSPRHADELGDWDNGGDYDNNKLNKQENGLR